MSTQGLQPQLAPRGTWTPRQGGGLERGAASAAEGTGLGSRLLVLRSNRKARGVAAAGSSPTGQAAAREPGAASRASPAPALWRSGPQRGCGRWIQGGEGDPGKADEPQHAPNLAALP